MAILEKRAGRKAMFHLCTATEDYEFLRLVEYAS